MKTSLHYTKEQRDTAKRENLQLVTLGYDGRHIEKGHPDRSGSICFQGPMKPKYAKMVKDFMLSLITEMNAAVEGSESGGDL